MRVLLSFCLLIHPLSAALLNPHAQGWHWYEEVKRKEEKTDKKNVVSNPLAVLEGFKKRVEALKARAVMAPTFEHVQDYMNAQKELLDKATRFAKVWLDVLYQTPSLDGTLKAPISQAGLHRRSDQKRHQMDAQLHHMAQTHGLFFFFGRCRWCAPMAKIVQGFAKRYGWEVVAISIDGSELPEFPDAKQDNGAAAKLGVQALPALMAVDPKSGQAIPLAYGFLTQDQIEDRVRVLVLEKMQ